MDTQNYLSDSDQQRSPKQDKQQSRDQDSKKSFEQTFSADSYSKTQPKPDNSKTESQDFDDIFTNKLNPLSNIKQSSQSYDDQFNTISFGKYQQQNLLDLDVQSGGNNEMKAKAAYIHFIENRVLDIQGPQLITDGLMTSYKLYRIKSRKNNAEKVEWDTRVARRFSDFEYLQKRLIDNHGGHIIPLLPEKNFWASLNLQGKQFMDVRKKCLLKYIDRLLGHPYLKTSEEVRSFLFAEDGKFSEAKGEYFDQLKAEDKVRNLAANAYEYGKDFFARFMERKIPVTIIDPTKEDLKLTEYQILINELARVIGFLRRMVENTAKQIQLTQSIRKTLNQTAGKQQIQSLDKHCADLLQEFEDLCKFIESCSQALIRRKNVRLTLDELLKEEDNIAKKAKVNPRSSQIDSLRNRIHKTTQQCDKWTVTLIEQLSKNVYMGRSMLENFIRKYEQVKILSYNSKQDENQ